MAKHTASEDCTPQKCQSCKLDCDSRKAKPKEETNAYSDVKKVIGVISGKGGVGKSLVTSMLAQDMNDRGYRTAILDADLTGPSIPQGFGLHERAEGCEEGLLPSLSKDGIKIMSINLLLEKENLPVIWRGPMIGSAIKQFWGDVVWGDVDFMFVDMPPGTGDVALTVFQSLPVDGLVIITSPQELVSMIVGKAVNMAQQMNVPILGIVENMAYIKCPDCGKEIHMFGESHVAEVAEEFDIPFLGRLPMDPKVAASYDAGDIHIFEDHWDKNIGDAVEALIVSRD
ncbi:MAG: Mrp/NBP35 family ATP-binding protein [Firmicutes bacterium]|nr:Mrp/NBP35 family ATP-binding protein [Bacillota bacterium]